MNEKTPTPKALIPILVFLALYLGNGIYFEYIHPIEGGMGFYVMSVVVAFVVALIVALLQNRELSLDHPGAQSHLWNDVITRETQPRCSFPGIF